MFGIFESCTFKLELINKRIAFICLAQIIQYDSSYRSFMRKYIELYQYSQQIPNFRSAMKFNATKQNFR